MQVKKTQYITIRQTVNTQHFILNRYSYMNLFLYFWNMKPDDGCLVQLKYVAFWITIEKCCVWLFILM